MTWRPTSAYFVDRLGARLVFAIEGMGTRVAMVELTDGPPQIVLAGHLDGDHPILVYRVPDLDVATRELKALGAELGHALEIPQGPVRSFVAPGGQRVAIYELARPGRRRQFRRPARLLTCSRCEPMTSTRQEKPMDWKLELVGSSPSRTSTVRSGSMPSSWASSSTLTTARWKAFRVVQLTPPGSACSISIGQGLTEAGPGTLQGMQLCVGDIDAAHAQLVERGVDVTPIRHVDQEQGGWADGKGGVYNSFIFFKDPDGNGWAVQDSPLLGGAGAES